MAFWLLTLSGQGKRRRRSTDKEDCLDNNFRGYKFIYGLLFRRLQSLLPWERWLSLDQNGHYILLNCLHSRLPYIGDKKKHFCDTILFVSRFFLSLGWHHWRYLVRQSACLQNPPYVRDYTKLILNRMLVFIAFQEYLNVSMNTSLELKIL